MSSGAAGRHAAGGKGAPLTSHGQAHTQAHAASDATIRAQRLSELSIDLEDRNSKKGTPPKPSEAGELRRLRDRTDSGS
jgi:hypothetical protein